MPTYQYVCTHPDERHEFERVQSFSDPAVSECPYCRSKVRKRYGSVGVVFKGSGFYRNDSRSGSGSGDGAKSDSAKSDSAKSDSSKSDSSKSDASSGAKSGSAATSGASSSGSTSPASPAPSSAPAASS